MNIETIELMKKVVLILIIIFSSTTFLKINIKTNMKKLARNTRYSLETALSRTKIDIFNSDKITRYLSGYGVAYMFQNKIDPLFYLIIKGFTGLFLILLSIKARFSIWTTVPAFTLGYFMPDLLFYISNQMDNADMMDDIKNIYDTLRIQTKAGVFLSTSLCECYLVVRNRRLKAALMELTSKIIAKNDIESSLDEFNLQFQNKYIDVLCMIIKQSMESGQSVQILSDLSGQIRDIQNAISLKEKEKLDRRIQVLQMLIFIGVLAICIYGLGVEMTSSLKGF